MNNRYLFKAKRIDNREWVKGSLINLDYDSGYCYITEPYESASTLPVRDLIYNRTYLVDRATICQCTGLKDKNGKLIWENDILIINAYSYEEPEDTAFGVVKYSERECGFCLDAGTKWIPICELRGSYTTEIFNEGNIFDNPELLEVE